MPVPYGEDEMPVPYGEYVVTEGEVEYSGTTTFNYACYGERINHICNQV